MSNKPTTIEELEEVVKELEKRIKNIADGWARDTYEMNRALEEMRKENRKLADRIEKLEKKGGLLNE